MGLNWRLPVLTLILAMVACSTIPGFPSLTPTPAAPDQPTLSPPDIAPLTVDQVLNAEYTIKTFDNETHVYKFRDGAYQRGSDPAGPDYVSIHLVGVQAGQQVVFGDLNQDGVDDAAVIIAENYGGTGVFVSVAAVLNENGRPQHAASYAIDDRPSINSLHIRDGDIVLDATVHGPNDPGCCPAMPVTRTFRLIESQLVLVGATSETKAGGERAITIDSPISGAEVSDTLDLTGSVTIAPFENNLSLIIYGPQGNILANSHIEVTAPDLGVPGTFDTPLDLGGLPRGTVLLMVVDFSAADGSVLALDSVSVMVR